MLALIPAPRAGDPSFPAASSADAWAIASAEMPASRAAADSSSLVTRAESRVELGGSREQLMSFNFRAPPGQHCLRIIPGCDSHHGLGMRRITDVLPNG
jgi:hypothetical protein